VAVWSRKHRRVQGSDIIEIIGPDGSITATTRAS
jgi:hypothetical protein